jgi:hypothetical protein
MRARNPIPGPLRIPYFEVERRFAWASNPGEKTRSKNRRAWLCVHHRSALLREAKRRGGRFLWAHLGNPGWHSGRGSGLGTFEGDAVDLPGLEGRHDADPSPGQFCFGAVPHLAIPTAAPSEPLASFALHRGEARLQGHHRSRDGARPRHRRTPDGSGGCDHDRLPQAWLLLCADQGCRAQAVICGDCDRGHIYCADCAPHARRRSLHAAGRRYQASHRGRVKHAARSRRYRARQNKVTHHGSPRIDRMLCWPRIRWWWSRNNRRWTVGRPHAGSDGAACVVAVAVQTVCAKASCRAGSTETDEEDPIMTIPPELEAQILRYYHVEKWRIGTIARQLRVHPDAVADTSLLRLDRCRGSVTGSSAGSRMPRAAAVWRTTKHPA